jgi:hypothetical protein
MIAPPVAGCKALALQPGPGDVIHATMTFWRTVDTSARFTTTVDQRCRGACRPTCGRGSLTGEP